MLEGVLKGVRRGLKGVRGVEGLAWLPQSDRPQYKPFLCIQNFDAMLLLSKQKTVKFAIIIQEKKL